MNGPNAVRVAARWRTAGLDDRGVLRRASTLFLNTSNPHKLREFKRLGLSGIKALRRDLPEPDADPLTVIRSKASQIGPNTIVEDTSLDVGGADVGVNVKWLLDNLDRYEGRKATFRVLLGILRDGQVEVYEGRVEGTLVPPRGDGFGFDPVFLPDGASKTLGEAKPDRYNARALAVRAFLRGRPARTLPPLDKWEGAWQGKTASSFTFRKEKSPLTYTNGFRNVQRLSLCDSDFVQPVYPDDYRVEKRRGRPIPDQYFVEREVWRHHSNRRPYKRLKKPVLDERIPGVSDPCIVAFLDYTKYGDDYFALAYIRTRGGRQGRGHATMLIEEFFRRHRKAKEIRWGKMMQPHIGHLWEKMQRKYPHIAQSGFPNWGGTELNPRKR